MPVLTNSAAQRDLRHLMHGYASLQDEDGIGPTVITGGQGIRTFDENGKPLIEAASGMWCASMGFSETELIEAAVRQLRLLPWYHTTTGKSVMPAIDLAERLAAIVPIPKAKIYFCLSGSEANDFLVKFIRYYNNAIGRPAKKKIISRLNGYHGATLGAGSLTGIPKNHLLFDLPLPGFLHTDDPNYYHNALPGETEDAFAERLAGNLEQMILREGPDTVAAFFAEPVAGSSGVTIPPPGYYRRIQEVLSKYDVLFVADEVITGFCRTGQMFGCQTMGIKPDAMSLAKGLTSSYQPLAAIVISDEIYRGIKKGSGETGNFFSHGATYSGHPVACAVGVRVLELLEERHILEHVQQVSQRFAQRIHGFAEHPLVGETRAVGLMGAVELVADKTSHRYFEPTGAVAAMVKNRAEQEYGLLFRNVVVGDACAFAPPLITTEAEVDDIFDRFARALDDVTEVVGASGGPYRP